MVPAIAAVTPRWLLLCSLLALSMWGPDTATAQTGPRFTVPPGFTIDVFADSVGSIRLMALDSAGTLLVSEPNRGRVIALPDKNGDAQADAALIVVDRLDQPHGLAFKDGALYVAETGRVLRFRYDPASMKASDQEVVVSNLPRGQQHWTRTVVFGPDGHMYVSVGSSCNVCREADKRRGAIVRYNANGSGETIFASGLRNAVGLAFHPTAGVLWATVNERDWRGDDAPSEYVTEVKRGAFYGWPDCMAVAGELKPDTRFDRNARCDGVTRATREIPAHSAPIGIAFYTGTQFPPEYRGSAFVAYRGSWNRTVPTGYKVVVVRFRDGRPTAVEDFVTGWLEGASAWGRPVDVIVGRYGALYVSDQGAGRIYRVSHRS
jgi:glucose/arabinose dehydrogenase